MKTTFFLILMASAFISLGACHNQGAKSQAELWQCPMHPQITATHKGSCSICGMDLVKVEKPVTTSAKELWQCPMHPQISSGKKGTCPICQMDLVRVEQSSQADNKTNVGGYAAVTLDLRRRQLIGVRTAIVARRQLARTLKTYGTISHDTELYGAQQEYLSALRYAQDARKNPATAAAAEGLLAGARKKLMILGYAESQFAALERSGASDESLIVAHGMRAWIYAQIYESDLPYVRPGLKVRIQVPGRQGQSFAGVIQSMETRVNPETRSVTARILAEHPNGSLTHDSYVQVYISVPLGEVLALPESAVLDSGERAIAFVAQGEGVFQPRELILGNSGDGFFAVLAGVKEGESVVVKANFLLDSESQLRAAIEDIGASKAEHRHD